VVARAQSFPADLKAADSDSEELLGVANLWSLDSAGRTRLLHLILDIKTRSTSDLLIRTLDSREVLTAAFFQERTRQKAQVCRSRKVIGMTITGAAIQRRLLKAVQPAVVIVEEAAEVLEAHLLAALPPGLQHLVLIGDHKQLRPVVTTHKLAKNFGLAVSMMERLIASQLPFRQDSMSVLKNM
jgi:superfamily I DNA and/or RNA helicase